MEFEFDLVLETVIYALVIVCLIYSIRVARTFAATSVGGVFYYFTTTAFLLGLHRVFHLVGEGSLFSLAEVNMYIWMHFIFYLGIIAFILGAKKLRDMAVKQGTIPFGVWDKTVISILVALAIAPFFIARPLEPMMASIFVGSPVDTLGLHHLFAFILALYAGYFVWKTRLAWGMMLRISMYPFLFFVVFVGVQHFWEALVESWKVLPVGHEVGEIVEQLILIFIFALFAVALRRIFLFLDIDKTRFSVRRL